MQICNVESEHEIKSIEINQYDQEVALLISGQSVPRILSDPELTLCFANLLTKMHSIIVYRSSPSQKAEIVKLIRYNKLFGSPITAAIGDGANDVNMI